MSVQNLDYSKVTKPQLWQLLKKADPKLATCQGDCDHVAKRHVALRPDGWYMKVGKLDFGKTSGPPIIYCPRCGRKLVTSVSPHVYGSGSL